ncbi:MAG: DUF1573 domain-containing protein [Ferruginibacter sp.]|nr:DUF1573 domain-containing protein [Cytophagales bacterium]
MTAGAAAQSIALRTANPEAAAKAAVIRWQKDTYPFGEIRQATPATAEFQFTNVGKAPVLITQVQGTCGCTVTDYSREPIQPGKSSKITVTYNAAGLGNFHKTVTVVTNAGDAPHRLTLQGTVVAR